MALTNPTIRQPLPENPDYKRFYLYLKQSITYQLALDYIAAGEVRDTNTFYPADFDTVVAVAKDLGDVNSISFETWWRRIRTYFGHHGERDLPRVLVKLPLLKQNPAASICEAAKGIYPPMTRIGWTSYYVELPASATRAEMVRLVDQIQAEIKANKEGFTAAKYRLNVSKVNDQTLDLGHEFLNLFQNTNLTMWRIGTKIGLSETFGQVLSPDLPKVRNELSDEKRILGIMTNKLKLKAISLAENAARGQFPSTARLPYVPDYRQAKLLPR
jgi:hypothetical protein